MYPVGVQYSVGDPLNLTLHDLQIPTQTILGRQGSWISQFCFPDLDLSIENIMVLAPSSRKTYELNMSHSPTFVKPGNLPFCSSMYRKTLANWKYMDMYTCTLYIWMYNNIYVSLDVCSGTLFDQDSVKSKQFKVSSVDKSFISPMLYRKQITVCTCIHLCIQPPHICKKRMLIAVCKLILFQYFSGRNRRKNADGSVYVYPVAIKEDVWIMDGYPLEVPDYPPPPPLLYDIESRLKSGFEK